MKRVLTASFALFFFLTGCAANSEMQKRRMEDKRNIAGAYIANNKYSEALRELLEAEKIYANDPYLQNDLGVVYRQRGKQDLAIQHFQRALSLKSDYSVAKNNLGVAYIKNEQWDQALACFKELTENLLYATPQYPLVNLGLVYYHKKDFAESEKYYQKALNLYGEGLEKDIAYVNALHGLGLNYIETGRNQEAVSMLEKAVQTAPRVPELHFDLARAYALDREYPKALQSYNKVRELAPDRPLAQEAFRASELISQILKLPASKK